MDGTPAAERSRERSHRDSLYLTPRLFGRAKEQAILRVELAGAFQGTGRLVLVGGEAGVGKTTLARDITNRAKSLDAAILIGSSFDLSNTPPYGPWLAMFEDCGRDAQLPAPPDSFALGQLASVTDQSALFAEVRRFFSTLAANGPSLVILEDLHWADPASLELLRHIGSHLRHWPVLVLGTYRPEVTGLGVPFMQQLPALVREAEGRRLDLRHLDEDALRSLVQFHFQLDTVDENRLVAYLEWHSDGNPFFATELLRTLEEEGLLRQLGNDWALSALDRIVVPPLLRQVINGRVGRLGAETRKLLTIASVIGQEVPIALWAEVADVAEADLYDAIEQAVEAHLLEADWDGSRVRFVHALTREALYEGILSPRRRPWHRRVAEALAASHRVDPDAVAFHLQMAADPDAWKWMVTAATRAQRAYAWRTAAERFQAAIDLLSDVEGHEREGCRFACRIGWLKRFSDPEDAISVVDAAISRAVEIEDTVLVAELGWIRGALFTYADRFQDGLLEMALARRRLDALELEQEGVANPSVIHEWFEEALPGTISRGNFDSDHEADQPSSIGQHFRRAALLWQLVLCGHYGEVGEDDRQFVARWDISGVNKEVSAALGFTYLGLAIADAARGHPEQACLEWTRARDLFLAIGHHAVIALATLDQLRNVTLTYEASKPLNRRRLAKEAEAALGRAGGALAPGVSPRIAWLGSFVLDGQWDEADRILQALPSTGNSYLRREQSDAAAFLARHRGQPEAAWEHIRHLFPEGAESRPGNTIHQEGLFLQLLAADLCLDASDFPGASEWLSAHGAWLEWNASELGRAENHLGWARYYWAIGGIDRARECAAGALACATSPDQPLVLLAAFRLLGEIETQSGNFSQASVHLATSMELASKCDVPFEQALTLIQQAKLQAECGAFEAAKSLLEDAREICTQLGAVPALVHADAVEKQLDLMQSSKSIQTKLTRREMEVLSLVAAGKSNPEIAEALFITRDTARTHVTNIFRKLDVGSRAGAVDYAHRNGLLDGLDCGQTSGST